MKAATPERTPWKTTEHAILREHYPVGGIEACEERLPHRTRGAIFQQARRLGLRAPKSQPRSKPYETNEWIDAQIRRVYEAGLKPGDRNRLSRALRRPAWWITRRAVELGVSTGKANSDWSREEVQIVEETLELTPRVVSNKLRAAGYSRTPTAIVVKRKRLGLRQYRDTYTARELAELMGIRCQKTVGRWIESGMLKAKRRGSGYGANDPWEIAPSAVRNLIIDFTAEIDIRKCDKFWLVDLLSGVSRSKAAGGD